MPLGSHDTGGSTTTTTPSTPRPTDSGVCAISPSDLVGYTGNLINRVNELEQRIAELEAANLEVNQLSDISQQVGWVGGVTYMGVSGWTQTSYGTLIPPAGFFIGDIIPGYQAGFYDGSGNLQLGFGTDGTITGATAPGRIAVIKTDTIIASGTPGNTSNIATLHSSVDDSNIITVGSTSFSVNQSGFYNLSLASFIISNQAVAGSTVVQWSISGQPAGALAIDPRRADGPTILNQFPAGAGFSSRVAAARMMYVDAAATHTITGIGVGVGATFGIPESTLTLELLRTAQL